MKKILVIHGPNLQLLGEREPSVYGTKTLQDIDQEMDVLAQKNQIQIEFFQSNHEGDIVDKIGQAKKNHFVGILINPAAYTHTSVAIRDAIVAIDLPVVEVHLSNIYKRESFRQQSLMSPVVVGQVSGFGVQSYLLGLKALIEIVNG